MLFDLDRLPIVGHDGGTPGQTTCWRIMPDPGVVVAIDASGGAAGALLDDVLTVVFAEVVGIRVPSAYAAARRTGGVHPGRPRRLLLRTARDL